MRVFRLTKLLLKGPIRRIFRVFPGHLFFLRGPSLVKLSGDDKSATILAVTVRIRMSPEEFGCDRKPRNRCCVLLVC